ncbi:hypothetical protein GH733_019401 [Mirounga leonina]|nr:hypothetical protein GH733_019401 [Mirounga leonina]
MDFDQNRKKKSFNRRVYPCHSSFWAKLGSEGRCFLSYMQVHCRACWKDYFGSQIMDAQVHCLNCPKPKCLLVTTWSQVKELVQEESFAYYDHILLQSSLDLMGGSCDRRAKLHLGKVCAPRLCLLYSVLTDLPSCPSI